MRLSFAVVVGLFLLLAPPAAVAQERGFGAKLGPSFAVVTVDPDNGENYRRRTSLAGGAFVVLPATHSLALQIEMLYTPKGAKLDVPDFNGTSALLLDYLDVPVLARIVTPGSKAFHVFAGPSLGIRVGAKQEFSSTTPGFTNGTREDISENVKRFEWGLVAGGGMHVGSHGVIDGRYSWGLTNVIKEGNDAPQVRNRVLTILAGLRF